MSMLCANCNQVLVNDMSTLYSEPILLHHRTLLRHCDENFEHTGDKRLAEPIKRVDKVKSDSQPKKLKVLCR